ncbi:MAG: FtsX-like permease family protein [Ruminococcus sp.]|nr:FtsX-like permease family protein [Ruminococcus sp.]
MKKALRKASLREIKGTFGRFFAIFAIIALGVGFFTGVRITTPAMVSMMDSFLRDKKLYDLRLVSTLGWEEEDVRELKSAAGCEIEGSVSLDVVYETRSGNQRVMKTHSLPERINGLMLVEGRMPEAPNECITDSKDGGAKIGTVFKVSSENEKKTSDQLNFSEITVVGIAHSSYYINFERGSTSIGNGEVSSFVYLPREAFDTDVYTEIFVDLENDDEIYSDEYDAVIKSETPKWEELADLQAEKRYQRLLSSANDELKDARQELEESRADGQKELDDSKAELDSAKQDLDEAKEKLDSSAKDIENGQKELDDAKAKLDDSKKQLDESEKKLSDGEAQLAEGQSQLDTARAELDKNEADLSSQEEALSAAEDSFQVQYGQLLPIVDQLPADQQKAILAGKAELDAGREQLSAAREQLEAGKAELDSQQQALDQSRIELQQGRSEYENGLKKYQDGLKEYESSKAEFDKGKKDYDDGLKEYEDGLKDYSEGLAEYEDGAAEFDEKIADAEKELAEAEEELSDIKSPDVYVLDRNTNIGYACFESDSQIVEQVARVFPIFFILVAALVCMTTMSRMVEEQRTQIGVLKALGYSDGSIMGKFMLYSGSASALGCVIGYAVGTYLFPAMIWMTYKLMYIPLDIPYMFDWQLALLSLAAAMICSLGTTWIACRVELRENSAVLMRPKAPKAGKRVLLERIPFIWNRLKFLHKVSIRNILRYKGRFFMMIVGIGGCTALLLTGFGLRDSVAGFAELQYGEVQIADASLNCKTDPQGKLPEKVISALEENSSGYLPLYTGSWDLLYGNKVKSITLMAPESWENMGTFMNFRTVEGQSLAAPSEGEALVSHSVADRYGAKVGTEIVLRNEDLEELRLTVTGIFENHVYNYIFVSSETLENRLSEGIKYNSAYVVFPEGSDITKSAAEISKLSDVTGMTLFSDLSQRLSNMMSSLDYIVLLIIVCAAGLAFVVIYDLTNINITERTREIATIKVLGFFRRETSAYVLRENLVLTAAGALAGLILGVFLHRFVMDQIVVDLVDFRVRVLPFSFVLSIILTFLFTVIVDLFMEIKLERISMADSLKSVD